MSKKQEPYKAIREDDDGIAFCYNDMPKCPHCGYEFEDLADWGELYKEGEHELDCNRCNLTFDVQTHVSISFSTDMIPYEFEGAE